MPNRYQRILESLFFSHYHAGDTVVPFKRSEIPDIAQQLGIERPKNLGDIIYSVRYRESIPDRIAGTAPEDKEWIIRSTGKGEHAFVLVSKFDVVPAALLTETKIPDATPGVIVKYALSDEQALLARLRYNRLVDIFTGLTCYSLQNHLRTFLPSLGQVETDELYVGIDKRGVHYVLTIQAKGSEDRIGRVQIEQDFCLCLAKFPALISRPIAAQFMSNDVIALFEFEQQDDEIRIRAEKHYRLVPPSHLSDDELRSYRSRSE